MPKARDYHLTEQELQIVETAMKRDQRPGVRQRCTAIRLLHLGYKPDEVAKMQAVSIPTVYSWIKRWRTGGVEELATKPRSGRPAKADKAYERLVAEVIEKGAAPTYLASLEIEKCDRIREVLRTRLIFSVDGSITLSARAWAVQGLV
ncbi:helix-turn-helix domain-containing protein [Bellilinea sp.]